MPETQQSEDTAYTKGINVRREKLRKNEAEANKVVAGVGAVVAPKR